jgi:hypothetical protein
MKNYLPVIFLFTFLTTLTEAQLFQTRLRCEYLENPQDVV